MRNRVEPNKLMFKVGAFCREHREEVLDLTLTEFCLALDLNIKNISAFELGNANNIKYLYYYYKATDDKIRRECFSSKLFEIL